MSICIFTSSKYMYVYQYIYINLQHKMCTLGSGGVNRFNNSLKYICAVLKHSVHNVFNTM